MFPQSWLSWLMSFSPVLLAVLGAVLFMLLNYASKDYFYWALDWFLETDVPFFKALGELVSLADCSIKGCGAYCILSFAGVSLMPTTLGSVLVLTLPIFFARHFVYPAAFKAASTTSRLDDFFLILDVAVRTVGVYQIGFWRLVGYSLL